MVLPIPADVALHLHDEGILCIEDEQVASTLHAGIIVLRDGVEARLALSRPETVVARVEIKELDLSDERTPMRLSDLWASSRPTK